MPKNLEVYEQSLRNQCKDAQKLDPETLGWLLLVHDKKVEYFKEERKMHFGAFSLVAILLFLTLPESLAGGPFSFYYALLDGLFFILLVPYVFYYAWYENRLRRLEEYYFRILEALENK